MYKFVKVYRLIDSRRNSIKTRIPNLLKFEIERKNSFQTQNEEKGF